MSSNASYQFPALRLVVRGPEKYRLIQDVNDAADVLVTQWPIDDGDEYVSALVACLDALHRRVPAIVVREALIRAADEVHIGHLSLARESAA